MDKQTKKIIQDELDYYFLKHTGYRSINGGYAEISKLKIKELKDGSYNVYGQLISGVQDEEHSEKYFDEIELNIVLKFGKIINVRSVK
jgi:hypothetical protein